MSPRLPSVLSSDDLPLPELLAARLDGELFRIDDCFSPVDEIEQPLHRARALAVGLPARLIAEQRSAAWIWGALDAPPRPHQMGAAVGARARVTGHGRLVVREIVITDDELVTLAGLPVTAPLRTAVDLARFSTPFADGEVRAVALLMQLYGFGPDDCIRYLDSRRNLPNKRRAALRLCSISPSRG